MLSHPAGVPLSALVCACLAACTSPEAPLPTDAPLSPPAGQAVSAASAATTATANQPDFDPGNFVGTVDNPFFPLPRGTRFVFTGTQDGQPLRDLFDVTHEVRRILGVEATVVLDRLYLKGELIEKTFDFFAQDRAGNVWYLGEDTKEFENGKVISTAGTWLAGKNGARPGIFMPAHPQVGQTTQQEFAAGVAEDMSTFLDRGFSTTVPLGRFDGCLRTKDFTPLEPGAKELKIYCRGVGFVKGHDVTGGTTRLELTAIFRK